MENTLPAADRPAVSPARTDPRGAGWTGRGGSAISAISASDTPISVAGSRDETLVAETLVAG
jgi:hypothetical protein